MDRQPILQSESVLLRPLQTADKSALYAVARDPEIWAQHPMHDRWQEEIFGAFFDDALAHRGALAVIDRCSDALAGSTRFQDLRAEAGGSVEIGWTFLACKHWGTGMNQTIKRLMLAHAFGFVETVRFRVGEENLRSRRALEKIGAGLTDEVEIAEHRGQKITHLVYTITRQGFATGPLSEGA